MILHADLLWTEPAIIVAEIEQEEVMIEQGEVVQVDKAIVVMVENIL